MTLRDRLRRWWSPATWNDEHPLDAPKRARRLAKWSKEDPKQLNRRFEKPDDVDGGGPGF
jgi:hypothetical protein